MRTLLLAFLALAPITLFAQNGTFKTYKLPSAFNKPANLTATEDRLYFIYNDITHGAELWYLEEPSDTPKLAIDHVKGQDHGVVNNTTTSQGVNNPSVLGSIGKYVYYISYLDTHVVPQQYPMLSKFSSTTNKVEYLAPSTRIEKFTTYKNKLYIYGSVFNMFGFFVHDPTQAFVLPLYTVPSMSIISFDIADDKIYYLRNMNNGLRGLYAYDLLSSSNTLIESTDTVNTGQFKKLRLSRCVNDTIYFLAIPKGDSNTYLYSHHASKGTNLVTDINTGKASPMFLMHIDNMMVYEDKLFFEYRAYNKDKPTLLYYDITKGTYDTVVNVLGNKIPQFMLRVSNGTAYNNKLFFTADYTTQPGGNANDAELCVYDPQTGGSDIIDVYPGLASSMITNVTPHKDALYMLGKHSTTTIQIIKYYEAPTSTYTIPDNGADVSVYPNPTSTAVHIDVQLPQASKVTITLTDIMGKQVHQHNGMNIALNHSITIPMEQLAIGTYIYKITNDRGEQLATGKLMKQ